MKLRHSISYIVTSIFQWIQRCSSYLENINIVGLKSLQSSFGVIKNMLNGVRNNHLENKKKERKIQPFDYSPMSGQDLLGLVSQRRQQGSTTYSMNY